MTLQILKIEKSKLLASLEESETEYEIYKLGRVVLQISKLEKQEVRKVKNILEDN